MHGRAARIAAGLWLAAGVVVWNLVFDRMIVDAGRDYVYRQQLHQRRRGPAVTIDEIMRPARRNAARTATLAATCAAGLGMAGTAYVIARRAHRPAAPPAASAPAGPGDPR